MDNSGSGVVQVFVGEWSPEYEALSIKATKQTSSAEIVECIIERLGLIEASVSNGYELAALICLYSYTAFVSTRGKDLGCLSHTGYLEV